MYLDHFGLNRPPFKITPDTRLFYPGGSRGEILEALVYAIRNGEGIVKVVGEVGSGKTMLSRMLEIRLPDDVDIVYLANPSVAPGDVMHAIALEMGLEVPPGSNRLAVLHILQERLLARHTEGRQVVCFVEEAQSMPLGTLEEIRLLSNLETQRDKLLQIVLFGQPELDDNLDVPEIRQLRERIVHSFDLGPFGPDSVREYVRFRMQAAGYRGPDLFAAAAYRKIASASEGLVRRINILGDKSLLAAFAENTYTVTPRHVATAIADSEFGRIRAGRRLGRLRLAALPAWGWAAGLAALGVGLGVGGTLFLLPPDPDPESILAAAPPAAGPSVPAGPRAAPPARESSEAAASLVIQSARAEPATAASADPPNRAPPGAGPRVLAPPAPSVGVSAVAVLEAASAITPPTAGAEPMPSGEVRTERAAEPPPATPGASPSPLTVAMAPAMSSAPDAEAPVPTGLAVGTTETVPVRDHAASSDAPAPADRSPLLAPPTAVTTAGRAPAAPLLARPGADLLAERLDVTRGWLAAANEQHFSIQLMMTRQDNWRNLEEFLSRWKADRDLEQLYVYETEIRGNTWYAVLFQEYETLEAARDALESLPDGLKRHRPYVRSIRNIGPRAPNVG